MEETTLQDLADKVDDVARLLARQATVTSALLEAAGRPAHHADIDLALLVELHALHSDAVRCAQTARSRREREAFSAIAGALERLLLGRGGTVVAPEPGAVFDAAQMEAVELVEVDDRDGDRRVVGLLAAGLGVAGRSVRPARVRVARYRPAGP